METSPGVDNGSGSRDASVGLRNGLLCGDHGQEQDRTRNKNF
ncbi:uncharacterized protein G6M90_00g091350 [Metarhizium brunneum]|uniref:Uncharacterized protein n=1 Tax=Metarhizium brunneum TaxID=500148 RepID=A0A7D5V2X0_9HYPO|nr:hypothetical protein G6M90_00g091350 [Metarhizium brunneum]